MVNAENTFRHIKITGQGCLGFRNKRGIAVRVIYRPNHPDANCNGMVEVTPETASLGLYVISDEMPALRHMADGKHYTSKAKFRAATKAAGCVEIGNDPVRQRKQIPLSRAKRREDIQRTIYNIRNGIRTENG